MVGTFEVFDDTRHVTEEKSCVGAGRLEVSGTSVVGGCLVASSYLGETWDVPFP